MVDSPSAPRGKSIQASRRETAHANVGEAKRELVYELISGLSGLVLALFMWGQMLLEVYAYLRRKALSTGLKQPGALLNRGPTEHP